MRVTDMGAGTGQAPSPRLVRAAHEFEGQMMKELLKPLSAGDGLTGGAEESDSGSALGQFAAQALAQGISQQGGFGIAERIVRELSRFRTEPVAGRATGNRQENTVLRNLL